MNLWCGRPACYSLPQSAAGRRRTPYAARPAEGGDLRTASPAPPASWSRGMAADALATLPRQPAPASVSVAVHVCQLVVCLACLLPSPTFGHANPDAPVPALAALQVEDALTVDGVLDEPFWARCEVGSGFIDTRTQRPAAEQTLVRVAYTRSHLYLAVECLDSDMSKIRATERHEDRAFVGDDWVEIHVDPPHNHRGKYAFFTNPLGTKADANEGPSGVFNYGWTADWECAARMLADRWTFEMKLPLTMMNYFRRDGERWGFNVTRLQRRTDVTSFWSFSATDMYKPRHFGHLTGLNLENSQFDRNWEFTPYVSARVDFNGATEIVPRGGADLSFRLTPAITTAWTLLPDYGHLEADDDTIELRDTERFLPEKRLFFREGEELMRQPHRVYYSRRFSEIDGAGKASGLLPGFSFNAMDVFGDVTHDGDFHGNSAVLRVMQDVRERSYLGYYASASHLEQGHAYAGSADGYLFLNDAWRVQFQGAVADERLQDPSQNLDRAGTDYLGSTALVYSAYPWTAQVTYTAITPAFNPLLGYIPRRDIFGPSLFTQLDLRSGDAWYKQTLVTYNPRYYVNADGVNTILDHDLFSNVVFRNDLGVRLGYFNNYRHLPDDSDRYTTYYNERISMGLDLWASDYYKAINLTYALGEFEDLDYHEAIWGKRFKFWERLPLRHELVVRWETPPADDPDTVWLNRLVADLYLSKIMWVKASIQNRPDSVHNYSVIYTWKLKYNTYFYVAYNDVTDGDASGRSVLTKITYTF